MNILSKKIKENEISDEKQLVDFLKLLEQYVFVQSTNSVTGEVEYLPNAITDMEGIIRINGEWDRENLKNLIKSHIHSSTIDLLDTIERMIVEKINNELTPHGFVSDNPLVERIVQNNKIKHRDNLVTRLQNLIRETKKEIQ